MFILSLIIASFLQSTFLSFNIVVILIISRSFLLPDRKAIYLAFLVGVMLAILTSSNLGFYPAVFLLLVKVSQILKNTPALSHSAFFFIYAAVCLTILNFLEQLVLQTNFSVTKIAWEIILTFPVFYLVRFWEERVNPRSLKDFRLRV